MANSDLIEFDAKSFTFFSANFIYLVLYAFLSLSIKIAGLTSFQSSIDLFNEHK